MTDPQSDPPQRRVTRELVGLLCLLVGGVMLAVVLDSVDSRLMYALIAVVLIGSGLWLGRGDGDAEGE